jgi:uncharacterized membrane protein YgcG
VEALWQQARLARAIQDAVHCSVLILFSHNKESKMFNRFMHLPFLVQVIIFISIVLILTVAVHRYMMWRMRRNVKRRLAEELARLKNEKIDKQIFSTLSKRIGEAAIEEHEEKRRNIIIPASAKNVKILRRQDRIARARANNSSRPIEDSGIIRNGAMRDLDCQTDHTLDAVELATTIIQRHGFQRHDEVVGKGGTFDGGGATGDWDDKTPSPAMAVAPMIGGVMPSIVPLMMAAEAEAKGDGSGHALPAIDSEEKTDTPTPSFEQQPSPDFASRWNSSESSSSSSSDSSSSYSSSDSSSSSSSSGSDSSSSGSSGFD